MGERKNYSDMLDTLMQALGSSEDQSLEEVKEELRAEGIDIDAYIDRLMHTVERSVKAAKRHALDQSRAERLRMTRPVGIEGFADLSRDDVLARIRQILPRTPAVSVSFRDLEAKSDDDLRSMLEDLELAKQMAAKEENDG